ncbi:hypothetical protein [Rhodococcus opacus]|uniref:Uncharacterized protein n=1 Tax=Rhodococcus opacus TaxID=37919 RepID=A0A2S8J4I4_RHOOP|nr:hypothetical protein [Rhodococcus opacus]PQP21971.1 hypothetical protein C5613_24855 [Rhodococcus opacus]
MSTISAEDHEKLRADCELRARLTNDAYRIREIIPVGDRLYDPQIRWTDPDESVVISDIGGQAEPGFDPDAGHGAIFRLTESYDLEVVSPPGMHGAAGPMRPNKAPASFGEWGGHIFFVAQAAAGRAGAHKDHCVYRLDPADGIPHRFADMPPFGPIGDGVAGAGMTGAFGPEGSPHEGYFFVQSLLNCVVYRIDTAGNSEPYLTLAPPLVDRPMMPFLTFIAPDYAQWSAVSGDLIIAARATTYLEDGGTETNLIYWRVDPETRTVSEVTGVEWRAGIIAPDDFGPYGGHMFTVDEGSTNLLHTTIEELNASPLPYDGRIIRIAPDGSEHVFADTLQGGCTTLAFSKGRLIVASARKSYSTGQYHLPDGSVYEIALA